MVTAQNFLVSFINRNGRRYSVSVYSSDVIGAAQTWSQTSLAVAGSPASLRIMEDVTLVDYTGPTGNTVSTGAVFFANGQIINGAIISYANQLNTLPNRAPLNITFKAGDLISTQQL